MSDASKALQKIAKGTGIIFAGTIISMFFGFLSRAIIARYFSTAEYGVFNLALSILNIALVIATFGFQNALPREVAFYKEREPTRIDELISTALMIVTVSSLTWMMILILRAESIAKVFNEERLIYALKIMAFALPFSALNETIISISRGFGRVRERVYFRNMLYPIVWLILVLFLAMFNLPFAAVFYAYPLAQALTFFALTFEVLRIKFFDFELLFNLKIGRKLITFSVPLTLSGILWFVMNWADTLMLGYYNGSEAVGIYNTATPLARLISILLNSVGFLYLTIISQLYAQRKINEMKRVYQILTKWIFLLALPIFSVMFLFPEVIIRSFFGGKYISAASALQILALGFMFHTFLGLNGQSLIVIGENKFEMINSFISTTFNIILNAILIPIYGPKGAAIATTTSYFVGNILTSARLYQKTKIHPFSWNYVKLLTISFVLLGLVQSLHLKVPNIWYTVPVLVTFLIVYWLLVLLSRSVDEEDVDLLLAIERKLGIKLGIVERVLKKFV